MSLALEADGSDEALDLGRLAAGLLAFLLGGDLAADNVLADIILLGEVEELADPAGALGAQAAGDLSVGEAGDFIVALFDNDEGEGADLGADDTAADRLALALAGLAWAVAGHALGEEKADALVCEHALKHGEALLVVAASNAEYVTLVLVTKAVAGHLLRDALVIEKTALALIQDLYELLAAGSGVRNVEFHDG